MDAPVPTKPVCFEWMCDKMRGNPEEVMRTEVAKFPELSIYRHPLLLINRWSCRTTLAIVDSLWTNGAWMIIFQCCCRFLQAWLLRWEAQTLDWYAHPVLVSPISVVKLRWLFLEPLRVKYCSDRSKVGECDHSHDWDWVLVDGRRKAGPHYIKTAKVLPLVEPVPDSALLVNWQKIAKPRWGWHCWGWHRWARVIQQLGHRLPS